MKLVKVVTAITASLVLSACSADKMTSTTSTNSVEATKTTASSQPVFETAAYFCDVQGKKNQVVSATYTFIDGKPDSATITINRKVVGEEMKLNQSYNDGTQFVEGQKQWTLDYGFSQASAAKTVPVMFSDNNAILAKNCQLAR